MYYSMHSPFATTNFGYILHIFQSKWMLPDFIELIFWPPLHLLTDVLPVEVFSKLKKLREKLHIIKAVGMLEQPYGIVVESHHSISLFFRYCRIGFIQIGANIQLRNDKIS